MCSALSDFNDNNHSQKGLIKLAEARAVCAVPKYSSLSNAPTVAKSSAQNTNFQKTMNAISPETPSTKTLGDNQTNQQKARTLRKPAQQKVTREYLKNPN